MKSPVTIIALLQIIFVVVGWLFIAGFMKLQGIPEPGRDWPVMETFRGMISLIVVPMVWSGFAAYDLYGSDESRFVLSFHVTLGIVLACILFAVAAIGTGVAMNGPHRGPIQAL